LNVVVSEAYKEGVMKALPAILPVCLALILWGCTREEEPPPLLEKPKVVKPIVKPVQKVADASPSITEEEEIPQQLEPVEEKNDRSVLVEEAEALIRFHMDEAARMMKEAREMRREYYDLRQDRGRAPAYGLLKRTPNPYTPRR